MGTQLQAEAAPAVVTTRTEQTEIAHYLDNLCSHGHAIEEIYILPPINGFPGELCPT